MSCLTFSVWAGSWIFMAFIIIVSQQLWPLCPLQFSFFAFPDLSWLELFISVECYTVNGDSSFHFSLCFLSSYFSPLFYRSRPSLTFLEWIGLLYNGSDLILLIFSLPSSFCIMVGALLAFLILFLFLEQTSKLPKVDNRSPYDSLYAKASLVS